MECISEACTSGGCDCDGSHFAEACETMSRACPSVGLTCSKDHAQCFDTPLYARDSDYEILHDLEELRIKRCRLEQAYRDGFINAGTQARDLTPQIEARIAELKKRGVKDLPDMSCEGGGPSARAPAEERPTPSAISVLPPLPEAPDVSLPDLPPPPTVQPFWSAGDIARHSLSILSGVLVYLVLLLVVAYIYSKFRLSLTYPQPRSTARMSEFAYGLFSFYQDVKITFIACLCPVLRWSDTLDKANDHKDFLSYWQGVGLAVSLAVLFTCLAALNLQITMGVVGLGVAAVGAYYRQKLRRKFEITSGTFSTFAQDCLTWYFCSCCAIIQEARQVESVKASMVF